MSTPLQSASVAGHEEGERPNQTATTQRPASTPTAEPANYVGAIIGSWRQEGDAFYIRENGSGLDYHIVGGIDPETFADRPILFLLGVISGQKITPQTGQGLLNSQGSCNGVLEVQGDGYYLEGGNCNGVVILIDNAEPLGSYVACGSGEDCSALEPVIVDASFLTELAGDEVTVRVRSCQITRNGRLVNPVVAVQMPGVGIAVPECGVSSD